MQDEQHDSSDTFSPVWVAIGISVASYWLSTAFLGGFASALGAQGHWFDLSIWQLYSLSFVPLVIAVVALGSAYWLNSGGPRGWLVWGAAFLVATIGCFWLSAWLGKYLSASWSLTSADYVVHPSVPVFSLPAFFAVRRARWVLEQKSILSSEWKPSTSRVAADYDRVLNFFVLALVAWASWSVFDLTGRVSATRLIEQSREPLLSEEVEETPMLIGSDSAVTLRMVNGQLQSVLYSRIEAENGIVLLSKKIRD